MYQVCIHAFLSTDAKQDAHMFAINFTYVCTARSQYDIKISHTHIHVHVHVHVHVHCMLLHVYALIPCCLSSLDMLTLCLGPGAYTSRSETGEGPKYSMLGRHANAEQGMTPG